MRQFINLLHFTILLSCFIGCEKSSSSKYVANNENSESDTAVDIVELLSAPENSSDFYDILNSEDKNVVSNVENEDPLADFYNGTSSETLDKPENEVPAPTQDGNDSILFSMPNSSDYVGETINSLDVSENENAAKDATIASLKELNRELLEEIKFLREFQSTKLQDDLAEKNSLGLSSNEEQNKDLENKLLIQQNQIDQLLRDNQNLESRVLALTQNPYSKIKLSNPLKQITPTEVSTGSSPIKRSATLQFDAVVTSINGKNKEAFYTEFFILPKDLESLLLSSEIQLTDYPKIDSYSELWARSRKNPFLYPGVQKKIRTLLLNEVNLGSGKRIRSDIDGAGIVNEISVGSYYIIGSAALGKIGVTWNTPINISSGINKLSLTLANSAWSL